MINTSPHILTPPTPEPATTPATPTLWETGIYKTTADFRGITDHTCIYQAETRLLVAACGPAGDPDSERDAQFICRAVNEYEDSKTHIANLEQENTELHDLIAVQRAQIESLQSQNRRLKARLATVAGYLRHMLAIFFDKPQSSQPSGN